MITRDGNLHLEIQTSRKNPVGLLRTSFYEEGKTKHTQHGRITGCTLSQLKLLQKAFREQVIPADSSDAFQVIESKEYGASYCIRRIIQSIGLDTALYSRKASWVDSIVAMITGRLLYAGSKLSLCHQQENTCLWEICGISGSVDVDRHCYEPLDELLNRQKAIQKKLAQKHLAENQLVLYDITSSYLEGEYESSSLVRFGYNRDGKKGHEQIVIGLICSKDGCPVGVEVFAGNTKDSTTVVDKVKEVKNTYGVEKMIFVGDRGMLTQHNIEELKEEKDFYAITALTRFDVQNLLERHDVHPDLFDTFNIYEITEEGKRHCLCRNPQRAEKDRETRKALLEKTGEKLDEIASYKQSTTVEILGARIGKILSKYKTGKYIDWKIERDEEKDHSRAHKVIWSIKEEVVSKETFLDGCYVITSTAPEKDMTAQEIVSSYKRLMLVEKAFRNLKTVQLEIRPIYHKKDDRIKAHVFLCMLAYYVQWHMERLLCPLLKEGKGKYRKWTFSHILETLKQITRNKVKIEGVELFKLSCPTENQQRILDLLQVKL